MKVCYFLQAPFLDSRDEHVLTEAEGARVNQNIMSGLEWMTRRVSAATRSLALTFRLYREFIGFDDALPLESGFCDVAHLSNLRCLNFSPDFSLRVSFFPHLVIATEGFLESKCSDRRPESQPLLPVWRPAVFPTMASVCST